MNKLEIFLIQKIHLIRRLDIALAISSFLALGFILADYSFAEISDDYTYNFKLSLLPIIYLLFEALLLIIFLKIKKYGINKRNIYIINQHRKITSKLKDEKKQVKIKNLINILGNEKRSVRVKDLVIAKIFGITIAILAISITILLYKIEMGIFMFVIIGLIFLMKYYQEGGMMDDKNVN